MALEFLSILIFTFALALLGLGLVTWFMERKKRRTLGILMIGLALIIAGGYAFLGSRYAISLFGRLIITIDLATTDGNRRDITIGMAAGFGIAGAVFLWISGRLVKPTRFERKLTIFIGITLAIALAISAIAVRISH